MTAESQYMNVSRYCSQQIKTIKIWGDIMRAPCVKNQELVRHDQPLKMELKNIKKDARL